MNKKNTERLYKAIDEVLFYTWDPIGVQDCPSARDEYRSYIPQIVELLEIEPSSTNLAELLFLIETEHMGLSGNINNCLGAAEKILEWKKFIEEESEETLQRIFPEPNAPWPDFRTMKKATNRE